MFAVPLVFVKVSGEHYFTDGKLVRLNPDLGGKAKIASYARHCRPGWHEIDFGFLAYVVSTEQGNHLVFPGLNPIGTKQKGRYNSLPKTYSKPDFENYIAEILNYQEGARDFILDEFNVLVHDLRRLSTAIYHAAEEAKTEVEQERPFVAIQRIDNIIGAQSMLKIRTDLLDFSGNPNGELPAEDVPIYRRVDKVVRCFQPLAASKKITLRIQGSSFSLSHGPNVFEIIPYIILDNAIKYSPNHSEINVSVSEDSNEIKVIFESSGPEIAPSEKLDIFKRGFRSANALASGITGSGIGLFLAKQLNDRFRGEIFVEVGTESFQHQLGTMCDISFVVTVPISRKLTRSPY